jgi:putative Mg2+ transporter-C (MgtC) family protein
MNYFELEMVLRLLMAAALGGLIGAERERRPNSGAGLRTHALVSIAAALVMIVSVYGFMSVLSPGRIVLDPSRVAAQVVSGVGFLGAGIIIFRRNAVRGLTTAASIWAVAAVGLACGCGLYVCASVGTLIMWFILTVMKKVEHKYFPQRRLNRLTIEVSNNSQTKTVSDKLRIDGLKIINMSVKHVKGSSKTVIKVEAIAEERVFVTLLSELQAIPGVDSVEYDGHALPIVDIADFDEEPIATAG